MTDLPHSQKSSHPVTGADLNGPGADDDDRTAAPPTDVAPATADQLREEEFGGIKWGSAFFGWLAAAGVAAILASLLAATGVALSLASDTTTADISAQADAATGTARTVGLVGGISLLVILFVAYFCGGYVASRMARFDGAKQGLAVWVWGIVVAVVVAVLVAVFGSR